MFSSFGFLGNKLRKDETFNNLYALDVLDMPTYTALPAASESRLIFKEPENMAYVSNGSNWSALMTPSSILAGTGVGVVSAGNSITISNTSAVGKVVSAFATSANVYYGNTVAVQPIAFNTRYGNLTVPANTVASGTGIRANLKFFVRHTAAASTLNLSLTVGGSSLPVVITPANAQGEITWELFSLPGQTKTTYHGYYNGAYLYPPGNTSNFYLSPNINWGIDEAVGASATFTAGDANDFITVESLVLAPLY